MFKSFSRHRALSGAASGAAAQLNGSVAAAANSARRAMPLPSRVAGFPGLGCQLPNHSSGRDHGVACAGRDYQRNVEGVADSEVCKRAKLEVGLVGRHDAFGCCASDFMQGEQRLLRRVVALPHAAVGGE